MFFIYIFSRKRTALVRYDGFYYLFGISSRYTNQSLWSLICRESYVSWKFDEIVLPRWEGTGGGEARFSWHLPYISSIWKLVAISRDCAHQLETTAVCRPGRVQSPSFRGKLFLCVTRVFRAFSRNFGRGAPGGIPCTPRSPLTGLRFNRLSPSASRGSVPSAQFGMLSMLPKSFSWSYILHDILIVIAICGETRMSKSQPLRRCEDRLLPVCLLNY